MLENMHIRGSFIKSCDSHTRALWILIMSSSVWRAAFQKQMKLIFKRIFATTLKKIATVGTGGQHTTFSTFFYPKKFIIVMILNISFYNSEASSCSIKHQKNWFCATTLFKTSKNCRMRLWILRYFPKHSPKVTLFVNA